jgi:hypothetical protein
MALNLKAREVLARQRDIITPVPDDDNGFLGLFNSPLSVADFIIIIASRPSP